MAARVLAACGDAGASRRAAVTGPSIRLDDDDILRSTRFFRSLLGAPAPQRPVRARTSVAPVGRPWKRPTSRSPSRMRTARNGWSPLVWRTQTSDSRTSKLTGTPSLPASRRACGTPPTTCVSARCRRPWPRAPVWTSSTSARLPRGFPHMPRPLHSPVHRPATSAGGPGGTRSPHHCSACARARSASESDTSPPLPFRAENARCAPDAKCVGCSAHVASCFGPAQAPTATPVPTTSAMIVRMLCPPRRRPPEESPALSGTASAGPPRSGAASGTCRGGMSAARRRCHRGTVPAPASEAPCASAITLADWSSAPGPDRHASLPGAGAWNGTPVFDEVEHVPLQLLGVLPRLTKAGLFVEASAQAIVSFDRHRQPGEAFRGTLRQPGVEQPGSDPAALACRQHVDSGQLRRLRRSPNELGKPDHIAVRLGDEKTRALGRERAIQALRRVPAVEQPALYFTRNDAGIGDRPRRPGDAFHLREIRCFSSPDAHAPMVQFCAVTRITPPGGSPAGSPNPRRPAPR